MTNHEDMTDKNERVTVRAGADEHKEFARQAAADRGATPEEAAAFAEEVVAERGGDEVVATDQLGEALGERFLSRAVTGDSSPDDSLDQARKELADVGQVRGIDN